MTNSNYAFSFCKNPYNNPRGREDTEWSNTWYSNANISLKEGKILIIGDSTGRKIRSTIERMSGMPVDFMGTSSGLHDLLFCSQLESFFKPVTWSYDTIYIWLGYHSLKNNKGEFYNESDYELFESDIHNLIDYLSNYSRQLILCSALYPVVKKDNISVIDLIWFHMKPLIRLFREKINEEEAFVIRHKNGILKRIAKEKELKYCDVNYYMLSLCEKYWTRCIHYDKIHYEGKSFPYIARFFLDNK